MYLQGIREPSLLSITNRQHESWHKRCLQSEVCGITVEGFERIGNSSTSRGHGNLLGILNTEVNTTTVHTLVYFYDPPFKCFTFQDYQLVATQEKYSHILGVGIKDRVPFVSTKELPKSHLLVKALHLEKKEVELNLNPNVELMVLLLSFWQRRSLPLLMLGVGMLSAMFLLFSSMGLCCFLLWNTLWTQHIFTSSCPRIQFPRFLLTFITLFI